MSEPPSAPPGWVLKPRSTTVPNPTPRDRLAQWLYETTPRRSDAGHMAWEYLPEEGHAGKDHHRQWAEAFLASKVWQAIAPFPPIRYNLRVGSTIVAHPTGQFVYFDSIRTLLGYKHDA